MWVTGLPTIPDCGPRTAKPSRPTSWCGRFLAAADEFEGLSSFGEVDEVEVGCLFVSEFSTPRPIGNNTAPGFDRRRGSRAESGQRSGSGQSEAVKGFVRDHADEPAHRLLPGLRRPRPGGPVVGLPRGSGECPSTSSGCFRALAVDRAGAWREGRGDFRAGGVFRPRFLGREADSAGRARTRPAGNGFGTCVPSTDDSGRCLSGSGGTHVFDAGGEALLSGEFVVGSVPGTQKSFRR